MKRTNIWPKLIWRGYDHAETKIKDIDRQLQFVNILKSSSGVWLYQVFNFKQIIVTLNFEIFLAQFHVRSRLFLKRQDLIFVSAHNIYKMKAKYRLPFLSVHFERTPLWSVIRFWTRWPDQRRFLDFHQNRFKLGCSSDVKSFPGKLLAFINCDGWKWQILYFTVL